VHGDPGVSPAVPTESIKILVLVVVENTSKARLPGQGVHLLAPGGLVYPAEIDHDKY